MIHALDGGANAPTMDFDAKRLLEVIAVRHSEQKPLTVTDANSAWWTPCLKATTAAPSIWFPHKQLMTTLTKLAKSCSKPSRPHKPDLRSLQNSIPRGCCFSICGRCSLIFS